MRQIKYKIWDRFGQKFLPKEELKKFTINALRANGIDFNFLQWTGLLDKAGKEIYEGDILQITVEKQTYRRMVQYDVQWATWYGHKKGLTDCTLGWYFRKKDNQYKVEVIGNIYKNKELLKRKD